MTGETRRQVEQLTAKIERQKTELLRKPRMSHCQPLINSFIEHIERRAELLEQTRKEASDGATKQ